MNFSFHPEAEAEFLAAIEYYEERKAALGEEFSLEIQAAIQLILSHPAAWPVLEDDTRRCLSRRFPYGILYLIEPAGIYILAVMHMHREPDTWKHRALDA